MTISLIVELALSGLLLATIGYCAVLERRLSALRKGQDGLKETIGDLNTAIVNAGASMRALKAHAADAAENLDERLARARGLIDELSMLTSAGERIADRIDRTATTSRAVANGATPAVLTSRLEALRPDALRQEALRNVR
jgi:phage shock protein A